MEERELLRREAARVLVIDPSERLLLIRGVDPARPAVPFWFTVGGGLEPGESARAGAVRELYEETGIAVPERALVGPLHEDETAFDFDRYRIEQRNAFFAVRVPGWTTRPAALEAAEVASIEAFAWWTLGELRAHAAGLPHDGPGRAGEAVYPPDLPDVLAAALRALA